MHVRRVLHGRGLAVQVGPDEEADEQVCQGQQVHHVEPDGERLAGGVDALDRVVLEDILRHARLRHLGGLHSVHTEPLALGVEDVLRDTLSTGSAERKLLQPGNQAGTGSSRSCDARLCGRGSGRGGGRSCVRHQDGNGVSDEKVNRGHCCANDELRDLHGRQGTLHDGWNADGECGHRVVRVLELSDSSFLTNMQPEDIPSAHGYPS